MGQEESHPDKEEQSNWEEYDDLGNGVTLKVNPQNNPVLCAVFDGDEKVTQPTATIQLDEQHWAAEAYADAKEKYE